MEVRDAVEADADAMAAVADAPTDAMRTLVHDRTVRVAVAGDGADAGDDRREDAAGATGGREGGADDAERDSDGAEGGLDGAERGHDAAERSFGEPESGDLVGFVSYDAGRDAVHVTQLAGPPAALDRLVEEPIRFAHAEGMAVKLVVPAGETATRDAAERAGFDAVGPGPSFAGEETVTYRLESA